MTGKNTNNNSNGKSSDYLNFILIPFEAVSGGCSVRNQILLSFSGHFSSGLAGREKVETHQTFPPPGCERAACKRVSQKPAAVIKKSIYALPGQLIAGENRERMFLSDSQRLNKKHADNTTAVFISKNHILQTYNCNNIIFRSIVKPIYQTQSNFSKSNYRRKKRLKSSLSRYAFLFFVKNTGSSFGRIAHLLLKICSRPFFRKGESKIEKGRMLFLTTCKEAI